MGPDFARSQPRGGGGEAGTHLFPHLQHLTSLLQTLGQVNGLRWRGGWSKGHAGPDPMEGTIRGGSEKALREGRTRWTLASKEEDEVGFVG